MSKIFYMPAPDITGLWAADGALPEYKEDVSVFKFIMTDDGKSAAFSVCDEIPACRMALTGLRRGWMSMVSVSAMFAPASTKSIFTVKFGTADLQADGGWLVRDKAEIEFVE